MARTLEELRNLTRRYADMVGSAFRTDNDVDEAVNIAWTELYDMLVSLHDDFFEAQVDIDLVAGQGSYAFESFADVPKVGKIRGVSLLVSDDEGDEIPLDQFQWSERGSYAGQGVAVLSRAAGVGWKYCVREAKLILRPTPGSAGETVRLYYVPQCPELVEPVVAPATLGDDEIDELPYVVSRGWEDFIARRAAASLLMDEQNPDAMAHMAEAERVKRKIEADAAPRDADAPHEAIRRRRDED